MPLMALSPGMPETGEILQMRSPLIIGFAGWSGAGKTTLITRLIPVLTARGISVSTIKHAHHDFDIDTPGKDSYEHRRAGATEVLVTSANRWALMRELRGEPEPDLRELLTKLTTVDVVLVEGFKRTTPIKIEVHRPSLGKPLIYPDDPAVVAVASDVPVSLPSTISGLMLQDVEAMADFVLMQAVQEAKLISTMLAVPQLSPPAVNRPAARQAAMTA
jgi:molybdopterin-guanine dinucleotide biosynthesis adapter protein